MQGTDNATMLLGRVLLSLLFLIGGTTKLLGPAATQAMFVKQGLPMVEAAWILPVVVELGGGLAMLFGLFTRPVGRTERRRFRNRPVRRLQPGYRQLPADHAGVELHRPPLPAARRGVERRLELSKTTAG